MSEKKYHIQQQTETTQLQPTNFRQEHTERGGDTMFACAQPVKYKGFCKKKSDTISRL